ncbi:MAG: hypothetical protein QXE78_09540 [Nitrososphaeria archaeon]
MSQRLVITERIIKEIREKSNNKNLADLLIDLLYFELENPELFAWKEKYKGKLEKFLEEYGESYENK